MNNTESQGLNHPDFSLSRACSMDKPSSMLTNTNLSPRELQVAQSASVAI